MYGLTELTLNELEKGISKNGTIFENFSTRCVHAANYVNMNQNFAFIPGHRILLLNFSQRPHQTDSNEAYNHPAFPILLQYLIKTALNNHEKSASNARYPELLMDFAIYIYIMAGKSCYEIIAANLPLPSAVTVGKFIVFIQIRPT